jgi:hypothetical protein
MLGYLALGETIAPHEIIGAVVIGSALLVLDGRLLQRVRGATMPKANR